MRYGYGMAWQLKINGEISPQPTNHRRDINDSHPLIGNLAFPLERFSLHLVKSFQPRDQPPQNLPRPPTEGQEDLGDLS